MYLLSAGVPFRSNSSPRSIDPYDFAVLVTSQITHRRNNFDQKSRLRGAWITINSYFQLRPPLVAVVLENWRWKRNGLYNCNLRA